MQYRFLGRTGIRVSRLCFGSLTIGPLQADLPVERGAEVIRRALEAGVNFIDTAEYYRNYAHIREAIRGKEREVVIASKSYAYTYDGMRQSVEAALRALGREYIDIFLLHEQESALTIRGHWEAVEYLLEAKKSGLVRAIGISTHAVAAVRSAALIPEFDVIHPLINLTGVGIMGGSAADMLDAIKEAALCGKGLYGMKALGGGHLLGRTDEALRFVLGIDELAAVAVGMQSAAEVDFNTAVFSGREAAEAVRTAVKKQNRRLLIEDWCQGCGNCVRRCGAGALKIEHGRAVVDPVRCRLCGYCAAVCPQFCLKVI